MLQPALGCPGDVIGPWFGVRGERVGVTRDSFSLFRCCWRLVCVRKC